MLVEYPASLPQMASSQDSRRGSSEDGSSREDGPSSSSATERLSQDDMGDVMEDRGEQIQGENERSLNTMVAQSSDDCFHFHGCVGTSKSLSTRCQAITFMLDMWVANTLHGLHCK